MKFQREADKGVLHADEVYGRIFQVAMKLRFLSTLSENKKVELENIIVHIWSKAHVSLYAAAYYLHPEFLEFETEGASAVGFASTASSAFVHEQPATSFIADADIEIDAGMLGNDQEDPEKEQQYRTLGYKVHRV